jgi:hypothetical protein
LNFEPVNLCYRTWFCILATVTIIGANGARAEVAVQFHCAGGAQLAGNTNLTALRKVLALRSTTNFEDLSLTRIAGLLRSRLRLGTNPAAASTIEPLLSDVAGAESLGSFDCASSRDLAFILSLRLDGNRAQVWHENLARAFDGSGEPYASEGFNGWRWNTGASNSFWIIPAQDWLLAGSGDEFLPLQAEYLQKVKAQGRPAPPLQSNWLEADIDTQRLGGWLRLLKPAQIRLTVAPKEDGLRVAMQVKYARSIPWKPEPCQIPVDLIRGQIISFTAGQDVAAFLTLNPALCHLDYNPLTNQFYFWALGQMPLLNYMAWPVANATNALQQLATEAPGAFNADLKRFNGTELVWQPDAHRLFLQNVRMFVPGLEAVRDDDGQFLYVSSFPSSSKRKPAPDALLAQVKGRTNLVYYDWEVTGMRLQEWQMLSKMIANRSVGQDKGAMEAFATENKWMGGLMSLVGNTVTEITRVAPDELSLVRTSPLGFTAVELTLLSDGLCDANAGPIQSPPRSGPAIPPLAK